MAPMQTIASNGELARHVVSRNGQIHFNIPEGLIPTFVKDAYHLTLQGHNAAAADLLTEANLELVDTWLQQGRTGGRVASLLLAVVQQRHGQLDAARCRYEALAQWEPYSLVFNELAEIQRSQGSPSRALTYRQQALQLDPRDINLAAACAVDHMILRQYDAAMQLFEQLWQADCLNEFGLSSYLWYLHYIPDVDRQHLFDVHRTWGQRYAPGHLARRSHDNDRSPQRPLRIGYVSADLFSHSVAYVFDALLQGHDRSRVEVYGYGNVHTPDRVTEYFIPRFGCYRSIYGISDARAAEWIRRDRIDILVATAGHSSNHRLKVLAYKPAPIQVDLGGINTTGMEQVDYRFTDRQLDPPHAEQWCLEQSVFLPGGALRYAPPQGAEPVGPLPALQNGYVTFGSFNNHVKMNPQVLATWARVMHQCPGSRLLLKFKAGSDEQIRRQILEELAALGIAENRVSVLGWLSHQEHWQCYQRVDIALDTFPFNGCITTLEALWMGVPTIAWAGDLWVSRMGLSVLTAAGLDDLTARGPDQWVAKTVALASNLTGLARLRSTLRQRLQQTALCDCRGFARDLEEAYRSVWLKWIGEKQVIGDR